MDSLPFEIQPLAYVLKHVSISINEDHSPFEMISSAPWWLRLLSRGSYCVYKQVIYVPSFHLELVSSEHNQDRTLATAKLLPLIMFLHDKKSASLSDSLNMLFSAAYQTHYFAYEFMFLKYSQHKFTDLISVGFMTTRRKWFGLIPCPYEEVYNKLTLLMSTKVST